MYPGRFWLGLGAGEALNEHMIGGEWPEVGIRSAMMFEAIEIIHKLFSGKVVKHDGDYFTLESARLYTRGEQPVPIYVATAGPVNSKRTGRSPTGSSRSAPPTRRSRCCGTSSARGARGGKGPVGDADPAPDPRLAGRRRKRRPSNAVTEWPNGGMPFPKQDIRNPEDFEAWPSSFGSRASRTGC